jgi:hypothetical protein
MLQISILASEKLGFCKILTLNVLSYKRNPQKDQTVSCVIFNRSLPTCAIDREIRKITTSRITAERRANIFPRFGELSNELNRLMFRRCMIQCRKYPT